MVGRWLLLATAVAQAAAPPLVGFQDDAADPPVVPPGPFFAVWSLVVTGCLLSAVWGFPRRRADVAPYRPIQLPMSLAQVGFVAWLLAAASPRPWLTLPVFLAMLVALGYSLHRVLETPGDRVTRVVLGGTAGVYAGWSTAAVWINAATLMPGSRLDGPSGVALQCAVVVCAAATAAAGVRLVRGQLAYTLTAAWALAGVAVSAVAASLPPLTVTAVLGALAVGLVAVVSRDHGVRTGRPGPRHARTAPARA